MPLSRYFKKPGRKRGKGPQVLAAMRKRYGQKKGTAVFYGTINNMRKGSKKQKRAQPKRPPGSRRGRR